MTPCTRNVDIRLPGKGNSNSMAQGRSTKIILMIKWSWTSRLSTKNSLSLHCRACRAPRARPPHLLLTLLYLLPSSPPFPRTTPSCEPHVRGALRKSGISYTTDVVVGRRRVWAGTSRRLWLVASRGPAPITNFHTNHVNFEAPHKSRQPTSPSARRSRRWTRTKWLPSRRRSLRRSANPVQERVLH